MHLMCLAIPAKVIKVEGKMAKVKVGTLIVDANIQLLEEVKEGDYIILHAGFGIQKLLKNEAKKMLKTIKALL